MRPLSPELLAAQQSSSRVPAVRVAVSDRLAGLPRHRWLRLYAGAEDDHFHAAVVAGDGSLVRARVSAANTLYVQAVVGPGPGSNFAAWTSLGVVSAVSGIALAAFGAEVLLFSVEPDQVTVRVRASTDNGQTFAAPATVSIAAGVVTGVAACYDAAGTPRLFYTVGGAVYTSSRTAGVWGAPAGWTNSASTITGLASTYQLDWDVALTGTDATGACHVWTCLFGDGFAQPAGTWSPLLSVAQASSGANVVLQAPGLDECDGQRLWFVERYTGPGGYTRPFWSVIVPGASLADGLWTERAPFDLTAGYGVAPARDAVHAWLSTPFGVWQAERSAPESEVAADVLEVRTEQRPFSGGGRLVLTNHTGRYALDAPNNPATIGAEVVVEWGYQTATGPVTMPGPAYWVREVHWRSAAGVATVELELADAWWLLEQWRARQQFAWAAGSRNVFQLLSFVLGRAGLSLAAFSSSAPLVNLMPAFTIQPGETGVTAVRRLLAMVPDRLAFEGAAGYLIDPQASDPAVYSYGVPHPITAGRFTTALAGGQQQVYGTAGVYGEAFDWAAVDAWRSPLTKTVDRNLTMVGDVGDRAASEARRSAVGAELGEVAVALNCGQQLYDVVVVTDAPAGLDEAKRRVTGIEAWYRRRSEARYRMTLTLGGV